MLAVAVFNVALIFAAGFESKNILVNVPLTG